MRWKQTYSSSLYLNVHYPYFLFHAKCHTIYNICIAFYYLPFKLQFLKHSFLKQGVVRVNYNYFYLWENLLKCIFCDTIKDFKIFYVQFQFKNYFRKSSIFQFVRFTFVGIIILVSYINQLKIAFFQHHKFFFFQNNKEVTIQSCNTLKYILIFV